MKWKEKRSRGNRYFRYLEDYEALVEQLVELHTFASLPSVLLIDDFDTYIAGYKESGMTQDVHIAKTCSLILDTMNSCARILKNNVSTDVTRINVFSEERKEINLFLFTSGIRVRLVLVWNGQHLHLYDIFPEYLERNKRKGE